MAKAAEQTNVGTAQWASVRFTGYTHGTNARFMFNVFASDEDGRYIFGTAGIIREAAVSAAMDILAIAALIDGQGLSEGERQSFASTVEITTLRFLQTAKREEFYPGQRLLGELFSPHSSLIVDKNAAPMS